MVAVAFPAAFDGDGFGDGVGVDDFDDYPGDAAGVGD